MAENYKHLYEQTKNMLTMYQDNLIPDFRQKIYELVADNERLRKGWAEAISAYSKANSLIPRWIPVSDPPKERECYFVTVKHWLDGKPVTREAYWNGADWLSCDKRHELTPRVTHWMPLPEPPKED